MGSGPINIVNAYQTYNGSAEFHQTCSTCQVNDGAAVSPIALRIRTDRKPASVSTRPWTAGWKRPTNWYREVALLNWPRVDFIEDPYTFKDSCDFKPCTATHWGRRSVKYTRVNLSSPTFDSSLDARARTSLLLKIKDSPCNLSVAFAERKETENLFVNTVQRITKSIHEVRHRRPKDWSLMLKSRSAQVVRPHFRNGRLIRGTYKPEGMPAYAGKIPEWWLEVQYGWSPAMSDVLGAMALLDRRNQEQSYRLSQKSGAVGTSSGSFNLPNDYTTNLHTTVQYSSREVCSYRVDYTLDTGVIPQLTSLGLTNPALLAWERVPFSFIADWFLTVGDWLNTLDATIGKHFLSGSRTRVVHRDRAVPKLTYSKTSHYNRILVLDRGSYSCMKMDRTVLSSFPSPALPHWKSPFSPTHVANALSLLVTAMQGGVPRGLRH